MNAKKTEQTIKTQTSSSATAKNAESFLTGIKAEFGKISWTSREELQTYTKIVVGATIAFGFGVFFTDLLIRSVLQGIETFARLIIG
ncbi:MAG: preprotein translocase subunit SecE [Chlamydiales bacterium]|nr:preprotein translocase subunit SecE [Chlamydiia bacterium]MCP5506748.1 preprotein translocase subunit SecE [Chlamydiales bacterium]